MAGKNNTDAPKRKRPRLSSGPRNAAGVSRQRPPSGRRVDDDLRTRDGQPRGNMRSIADLLGHGRSRAEEVLGEDAPDDAWANITNTLDNLGSASVPQSTFNDESKSRALLDPDTGETADTMNPSENSREATHDRLMLDLSLKTRIQVNSPHPLRWAITRSPGQEYDAMNRLLTGNMTGARGSRLGKSAKNSRIPGVKNSYSFRGDPSEEQLAAAKVQLFEAMLHFRCPSGPLPLKVSTDWSALIESPGKVSRQSLSPTDNRKSAVNRLIEWQSALQSLFFGYRYGHVANFYVLLSTTVVFFSHVTARSSTKLAPGFAGGAGSKGPLSGRSLRAAIAGASPGVQSLMEKYQVEFRAIEETEQFEQQCVVVEDNVSVHALYNLLFAVGEKISNATDVPLLIADRPFRGCTIVPAEITSVRKSLVPGKDGQAPQQRHTLQMRGLFTPRQVQDICSAMAVIQKGSFDAKLESDAKGTLINACGHDDDGDKYKVRGASVISRVRKSPEVDGVTVAFRDA